MKRIEVPAADEVPRSAAGLGEFVRRFDPARAFQEVWGADFVPQADALEEVLTAQLRAGRILPEAPLEDLLFCFCRMWTMAPYLGIDSAEDFLRNPRAKWLLAGIRERASSNGPTG